MRRIEKILLSKVPVWIVVVLLALAAAGAVLFGALVEDARHLGEKRNLGAAFGALVEGAADGGVRSGMAHVAIKIARIPKTLYRLLWSNPARAGEQRFDDQAGLEFAGPAHLSGKGYLLLVRFVPAPAYDLLKQRLNPVFELIDLSRRKTVHFWYPDPEPEFFSADVLPDGSLVLITRRYVARLDPCSNLEWRKWWHPHHSIERDADGNFWVPIASVPPLQLLNDGLLKFSPSGEALSRVSVSAALMRSGYRHLLYTVNSYDDDPLHVNDVQPVLRDGPFWRRGDLFVSLRTNSVVLLYRPATDEVVWLRQGPWLHQHDVDVVSDSEISVFSNNTVKADDNLNRILDGANEVYVYDFATDEARSPWREAMRRHDVRTPYMGTATVFGDGGLMVEEHVHGRILRMSADGALRWSYVNRASDGRVYRLGWSRYLDAEYGAEVARSVAVADCTSSGPQAGAAH